MNISVHTLSSMWPPFLGPLNSYLRRGFAERKARHSRGATARALRHLRRGFAELETHSRCATARVAELKRHLHGATARALRHAQSPLIVRRAQDTFARRHSESASTRTISAESQDTLARRHSESASTRTISAEGSPSSSQICAAPQRERFDTHNLR